MKITTLRINAVLICGILGVMGCGLGWILVQNNVTDARFVEVCGLLAWVVKGLVDVAKTFAGVSENQNK